MSKARVEKSAGIVLVNSQKKFLVVFKKWTKVWEFPQGKIEKGEDLLKALKREVREETGIKNFELIKEFQKTTHYRFRRERYMVNKTVTYFLGTTDEKVKLSDEHEQYRWCTAKEASKLFKHKNHRDVLMAAIKAIESFKAKI